MKYIEITFRSGKKLEREVSDFVYLPEIRYIKLSYEGTLNQDWYNMDAIEEIKEMWPNEKKKGS